MSEERHLIGSWKDDSDRLALGLIPYLEGVVRGSDLDIRSPLFEKRPRVNVAEEWMEIIESREQSLPGSLFDVEVEQMDKIGSKSIKFPLAQRMPSLLEYWSGWLNGPSPDGYTLPDASGKAELRPLSFENAVKRMKLNTNSGWPYFTRRSTVVDKSLDSIRRSSLEELPLEPAILGWRGQSSGLDSELSPKQRTVWMYPFHVNIQEMAFYRPLADYLLKSSSFKAMLSAWRGPVYVDQSVGKLFGGLRPGSVLVSLDFSSFDQTLGPPLTTPVFEFVRSVFRKRYEQRVTDIEFNLHSIPLIISPTLRILGEHGVSSGSVFTNLVDTLAQINALEYSLMRAVAPLSQFQGDDGLTIMSFRDVDQMFRRLQELGLDTNEEKTRVSPDDCTYLQRYFTSDYGRGRVGIYPTMRALNSLMSQERFFDPDKWGPNMVVLRSLMILENCRYHPLFEDFVRFVASGDTYSLGAALPGGVMGLVTNSKFLDQAEDLAGFVPTYNQRGTIRGLSGFTVVKFVHEQLSGGR
jgi:hypothetical protein